MARRRIAPTPLQAEPGSPPWFTRFLGRLNERIERPGQPGRPGLLYDVDAPADLPDPAQFDGCVLFVRSIDRIAVSNGVAWIRQDTGAAL